MTPSLTDFFHSSHIHDQVPAQFASRKTAEDMALMAYNRAPRLSLPGSPVLGLGFTGSLASTHPKRGDHRFHVSARTSDQLLIKERVRQFEKAGKTVIISNQPYFYKKVELFPDTAARLINPKYYGGDYGRMLDILSGCKNMGCLFLIGGRNMDGVFKVLDDLDISEQLNDMLISIPAEQFRMDISSTEIRKNLGIL